MTARTPSIPPHAALIRTLRTQGWDTSSPETSALITGLETTTLTAPAGELTVKVENLGAVAMLTVTANAPDATTRSGPRYPRWRATAPMLTEHTIEELALAATEARLAGEGGVYPDDMASHLEPKGWKLTEEHSHDELIWGQLTSPDATHEITWGPDEESWLITDRTDHTAITADLYTPVSVLCVLAAVE